MTASPPTRCAPASTRGRATVGRVLVDGEDADHGRVEVQGLSALLREAGGPEQAFDLLAGDDGRPGSRREVLSGSGSESSSENTSAPSRA
jgi:hypothetical protein